MSFIHTYSCLLCNGEERSFHPFVCDMCKDILDEEEGMFYYEVIS